MEVRDKKFFDSRGDMKIKLQWQWATSGNELIAAAINVYPGTDLPPITQYLSIEEVKELREHLDEMLQDCNS